MPRYAAPNHPDCWVDCPFGGYAIFVSPHGPCEKGCDDLESALARVLRDSVDVQFSYYIEINGRRDFTALCLAITRYPLHRRDRRLLQRAIGKIRRPAASDYRLVSRRADATIGDLVRDIYEVVRRATRGGGGPHGGGSAGVKVAQSDIGARVQQPSPGLEYGDYY